jgi:hypothetical protein
MTPLDRARAIAREFVPEGYDRLHATERIRVAMVENANVELEKRREAEARILALEAALIEERAMFESFRINAAHAATIDREEGLA